MGKSSTKNQEATYPVLELPAAYEYYRYGNPFPERMDKHPPEQPKSVTYESPGCLGYLLLGGLVSVIGLVYYIVNIEKESREKDFSKIVLVLVCVILIAIWAFNIDNKNEAEFRKRQAKMWEDYQKLLEEYKAEEREFKRMKEIEANKASNLAYRKEKMAEALLQSSQALIEQGTKRGKSEAAFIEFLRGFLGSRIKTGLVIERFISGRSYQPDIIFHHEASNIWIDIEIDEPYDALSKTPIHYIDEFGFSKDWERDSYFTSHGWTVIRFSESQVVQNPAGCLKYIAWVLQTHFDVHEYVDFVTYLQDLKEEKRWTFEDADLMAFFDTRGTKTQTQSDAQTPFENEMLTSNDEIVDDFFYSDDVWDYFENTTYTEHSEQEPLSSTVQPHMPSNTSSTPTRPVRREGTTNRVYRIRGVSYCGTCHIPFDVNTCPVSIVSLLKHLEISDRCGYLFDLKAQKNKTE
ncbi:MAG: DUF559 domain-containing protein, partial [Sphingobacteriales bacterium]